MKVCLIDLPAVDRVVPNLGIAYLASSLMEKGHYVKIIDLTNSKHIEKRLQETCHYDMVGISVKSFAVQSALEVSRMVKSENLPLFKLIRQHGLASEFSLIISTLNAFGLGKVKIMAGKMVDIDGRPTEVYNSPDEINEQIKDCIV